MPKTITFPEEQPEQILHKLFEFAKIEFAGLATEIAGIKAEVAALGDNVLEVRTDVTQLNQIRSDTASMEMLLRNVRQQVHAMVPHVEEASRNGRTNRDLLLTMQEAKAA